MHMGGLTALALLGRSRTEPVLPSVCVGVTIAAPPLSSQPAALTVSGFAKSPPGARKYQSWSPKGRNTCEAGCVAQLEVSTGVVVVAADAGAAATAAMVAQARVAAPRRRRIEEEVIGPPSMAFAGGRAVSRGRSPALRPCLTTGLPLQQ